MRTYKVISTKLLSCKEIVEDIKNKDFIINEYGEEWYRELYVAMTNSAREVLKSNNCMVLTLPSEEYIIEHNLNPKYDYVAIEVDCEAKENTVFNVDIDLKNNMCYVN